MGVFASIGFMVPWLLVAFYAIAHRLGGNPSIKRLLFLCPYSIISLGLDNASLLVGLFGWLLISVSNAVLYSIPGVVVSLFVGWRKSA
ncbi:MAG: hypothetical protein WBF26_19765 [Candidatus Sulfotelmatobacter sp.]